MIKEHWLKAMTNILKDVNYLEPPQMFVTVESSLRKYINNLVRGEVRWGLKILYLFLS